MPDVMPAGSPVPGREDLTCPLSRAVIKAVKRHAREHPWPGNTPLTCPAHILDTTAITEPRRPVRLLCSVDYGYHNSGWFSNCDWESNWHLSFSHPVLNRARRRLYAARPEIGIDAARVGMDLETVSDDEVRAWGLVFFGPEHAPKAWFRAGRLGVRPVPVAQRGAPAAVPGQVGPAVHAERRAVQDQAVGRRVLAGQDHRGQTGGGCAMSPGIEAQLRAAGFPIAGPEDEPPLPRCACGCGLFSHERSGASLCVNRRTCRCPGWLPERRPR